MGWTGTHRPYGQSLFEFFSNRFNCDNEYGKWTVLKCSVVRRTTAYLAVELIKKKNYRTPERIVFAIIVLIRYSPQDYYNITYKEMDETVLPYSFDCPETILNLLTPTKYENAIEWRMRCRERIRQRKALKLKVGTIIEFCNEIKFDNGFKTKQLKVWSVKPLLFIDPNDPRIEKGIAFKKYVGGIYRFPRNKLIDYEAKVVGE